MQMYKVLHAFGLTLVTSLAVMVGATQAATLDVTSVEQTLPIGIAESNGGFEVPDEIMRTSGGSNVCGNSRSPWSNLTQADPDRDKGYLSLGPRNKDGDERQCSFVEFDVGFDATSLSLLWGSPDTYNTITLYNVEDDQIEGEYIQEIGSITPASEGSVPDSRTGAYLVSVSSSESFNRVKVENTSATAAAFEFSNLIVGASVAGGDLGCGDSVPVDDGSLTLRRVDTNEGDCATEVDFQLGFDGEVLTVLTDPVEGAAYFVELPWGTWVELPDVGAVPAFEENPETVAGAVPLPAHTFGLSLDGEDDSQGAVYALDLCPGQPVLDQADEIVGYDLSSINGNPQNDMSPKPGFQFACSARRTQLGPYDPALCPGDQPPGDIPDAVCVGFDELIYIEGDWFSSRNLR